MNAARPIPIILVCLLGSMSVTGNYLLTLMAFGVGAISYGVCIWSTLTLLAGLLSIIALWRMQRWGVFLYCGVLLVNMVLNACLGTLPQQVAQWPVVTMLALNISVMLCYLPRMQ